jgi:hypothetical protein
LELLAQSRVESAYFVVARTGSRAAVLREERADTLLVGERRQSRRLPGAIRSER